MARNTASDAVADGMNAETDRRKLLIVALAGLGVLAVIAVVLFSGLLGGSSDDDLNSSPLPTPRAKASAVPPPTSSPSQFELAPAAAYGDPFAKLPEELAAEAASQQSTAATAPVATGTGTTDPAAAGAPATGDAATGTTTASGTTAPGTAATSQSAATTAAKPVQLIAVSGGTAKVEVDSVAYPAKSGAAFAGDYKAVSVSADSITISHGGKTVKLALGELQNL